MNPGQLPNRIRRGDVVWVADPFDFKSTDEANTDTDHPYVVISTDSHPFQGTEYLAMLITTTEREQAVAIPADRWVFGQLSQPSWISPWTVVTLKDADLDGYQGALTSHVVDEAVKQLPQYVGLSL